MGTRCAATPAILIRRKACQKDECMYSEVDSGLFVQFCVFVGDFLMLFFYFQVQKRPVSAKPGLRKRRNSIAGDFKLEINAQTNHSSSSDSYSSEFEESSGAENRVVNVSECLKCLHLPSVFMKKQH